MTSGLDTHRKYLGFDYKELACAYCMAQKVAGWVVTGKARNAEGQVAGVYLTFYCERCDPKTKETTNEDR